jgi:hypothetical protein
MVPRNEMQSAAETPSDATSRFRCRHRERVTPRAFLALWRANASHMSNVPPAHHVNHTSRRCKTTADRLRTARVRHTSNPRANHCLRVIISPHRATRDVQRVSTSVTRASRPRPAKTSVHTFRTLATVLSKSNRAAVVASVAARNNEDASARRRLAIVPLRPPQQRMARTTRAPQLTGLSEPRQCRSSHDCLQYRTLRVLCPRHPPAELQPAKCTNRPSSMGFGTLRRFQRQAATHAGFASPDCAAPSGFLNLLTP